MCPPARLGLGPTCGLSMTLCSEPLSLCGPSLPSGTDKGSGDQFLVPAARDERLLALGLGIERTPVEV